MGYEPNKQEFEAVMALSGTERYCYLIIKITDWEEVWSVADEDGWGLMANDHAQELVPIWPFREFASVCCCDEWQRFTPHVIALDDWIEKWLPGIAQDQREIAAFPLPQNKGIIVSPQKLQADIEEELQQYG